MTWLTTSKRLITLLPIGDRERLGTELEGVIQDTHDADDLGPYDAASIGWLVMRRWLMLGLKHLPLLVAGVPVGIFAFLAILDVSSRHFMPWEAFETVQSTTPTAIAVRTIVDRIIPIALVICVLTGARAVQYVRRGSYYLPAALLLGSYVMMSRFTGMFLDRTDWAFRGELAPSSVDQVSPYSIAMLGATLSLPIGFLIIDLILSTRSRRMPLSNLGVDNAGPLILALTVTSLATSPILSPLMIPLIWMSTLSRRTKLLATLPLIALVVWVGAVLYIDD